MILLSEVSKKIDEILNGVDNPTPFSFLVATQGYHLDKVADKTTGKNLIPVFVSTLGGTLNPVPDLEQSEGNVPITIYAPVRFKEWLYQLNVWLGTKLVGKVINYGKITGSALTNMSLPNFGEIVDLDLKEFQQWTDSMYKKQIEVMEPYISMTINLFINSVADGFFFCNDVKITKIKVTDSNGTTILEDTKPIIIDRAEIGSCEPAAQQIFGDNYARGFGANASYTKQIPLIIKNESGYRALLEICEKTKNLQSLHFELTELIPFTKVVEEQVVSDALELKHNYFVTNYTRRTALGQLLGVSFTLADDLTQPEDDDEEEVVE